MFRAADVVVVNKIDLLPHLDFDMGLVRQHVRAVNPTAELIELSAAGNVPRTPTGRDRALLEMGGIEPGGARRRESPCWTGCGAAESVRWEYRGSNDANDGV